MDWGLAIKKNRDALIGVVALLLAQAGFTSGNKPARLSKSVHRAVIRLIRPAESAARRLIVIMAFSLKPLHQRDRSALPDFKTFSANANSRPAFRLIDPRKRFGSRQRRLIAKSPPRISVPGISEPCFTPAAKPGERGGQVNPARLIQRLQALQIALDDLPKQARRLARYTAKMQTYGDSGRVMLPPLRPGRPPGYNKRRGHTVDDILTECDLLARDLMQQARARGPTSAPNNGLN